jgi:2-polyprenyl-3-methyl-5-hydroxy-6-metoxy-1,4-benzoquinol methylase
MSKFSQRSSKTELLDAADIPFADIEQNMRELDKINHLLGGHRITVKGIRQLIASSQKKITICEIGCGGGDNLKVIHNYCIQQQINVDLIGIDIKAACINYAAQQNKQLPCQWICSDYAAVNFGQQMPDIIFSSLFCHHFSNPQLTSMLEWMRQNSRIGFFINDLHRHPLAYYSIRWLTQIFSSSYLVKNDAPISVERGFRKSEWIQLCQQAGLDTVSIKWEWAFRHLIVYKNEYPHVI